jgi:hypothetical protein
MFTNHKAGVELGCRERSPSFPSLWESNDDKKNTFDVHYKTSFSTLPRGLLMSSMGSSLLTPPFSSTTPSVVSSTKLFIYVTFKIMGSSQWPETKMPFIYSRNYGSSPTDMKFREIFRIFGLQMLSRDLFSTDDWLVSHSLENLLNRNNFFWFTVFHCMKEKNLIKVAGSGAPEYKFHGHIVIQIAYNTRI